MSSFLSTVSPWRRPVLARAFTLIELLVVITIIVILAALLLPAAMTARQLSRRSVCLNQVKQIYLATVSYGDDCSGYIPRRAYFDSYPHGMVGGNGPTTNYDLNNSFITPYIGSKNRNRVMFCPGRQWAIIRPGMSSPLNTNTTFVSYQLFYLPLTTSNGKSNANFATMLAGYGLWSCRTLYTPTLTPVRYAGHDTASQEVPDAMGAMNAAYTDGSGRWVLWQECSLFEGWDNGKYLWPTPPK